MNKESALLEIGKFHLFTWDLEPEFVTPKFRLKIHAEICNSLFYGHQTMELINPFIRFWLLLKSRLQIPHPNTPLLLLPETQG